MAASPSISINHRLIGSGHRVYIVAEMSANHGMDFNRAVDIIKAAKEAGADAIKLQTYTPDTLTIDCDSAAFNLETGPWVGKTLYALYGEAYTPWDWQPKLKNIAESLGLDLFSTPFDPTAVDFLETMKVPAHKVASFEIVDIPLLRKIAATKKPVILSTGMATLAEIDEAVRTLRTGGCDSIALLKCTSAYPAPPEEMNLKTIPHLSHAFNVPAGLSDHSLDIAVGVTAVAIGACIVEKHLTLNRSDGGPDSHFSLEPDEFKMMVNSIRIAEKAIGSVCYARTEKELASLAFRRSLFVVQDMNPGETFSETNLRSIRPGYGISPKYLQMVMGKAASQSIRRGTPLSWDLVA